MLGLIIGVFIGSFITIVIMSLMAMAKDYEPKKHEPEHKEPTILWTVGNICKWNGEIYEIRFFRQDEVFRQDKDGQTLACIFLDGATTGIWVPIEELEAAEK